MTPLLAFLLATQADAVRIDVHLDQPTIKVSPSLYGIFFEEINQGGEGGLYSELVRNRGMEGGREGELPTGWKVVQGGAEGTVSVDASNPLNEAKRRSLKIERRGAGKGFAVVNEGFWGIPVRKGGKYRLTLWVKGEGMLMTNLTSASGEAISEGVLRGNSSHWERLEYTFQATKDDPKARLTLTPQGEGPMWVAYASLQPLDTWKGRANGLRKDLGKHVEAMRPAFVRFPGGCFVEGGDNLANAFNWKASIGPMEQRPGLAHSMWGYPTTDGLGFHEYLQWCEDLRAEPLFVVNCGMSHREITPMAEMGRWVQDALDAIEYANGPTTSKWGALRAKNGHPKPFNLKYIEIGNENGASWSFGGQAPYAERYRLIYDAIKRAHPEILTIADNPVPHPMEIVDEHYYNDPRWFWENSNRYDRYDRKGPRIYVGEYAVTKGCGQGNLAAALAEAAFMAGMEKNSDIVTMSSYAPLFVNVNNKQWNPDAIVFDANRSYGTPSYWAQNLFANNRADRVLAHSVTAPVSPPPPISGTIGLQTWRTSAEFKDIQVEADGRRLYSSDGSRLGDLKVLRGDWAVANGSISQTSEDENREALIPQVKLDGVKRYTLSLKARKRSGNEGFIVMFDNDGNGGSLQWNLGGWANTQHAFQRNGAIVGRPVPGRIEADRWYDIRIEREANKTRAYLDGKLVQELQETGAPDFAAVAGVDDRSKEVVIKVVNGSDQPRRATLNLLGGRTAPAGRAIVMSGSRLDEENTFDAPNRVSPRTSEFALGRDGTYTFAPRSVTILRVKVRAR